MRDHRSHRDRLSMLLWALSLLMLATAPGCGGGSPTGPSGILSDSSQAPTPTVARVPEGAYHAANPWTGNHLGELPPGLTLAHVFLDEHETNVAQFFGTGRRIIVGAHNWGFHPEKRLPWEKAGPAKWTLRRDYESSYARLETLLRPYRSSIFAIEIADEPNARRTPVDHVQTAIAWWEDRGYPTIVNEQIARLSRPQGLTHFAITCYQQGPDGCWDVDWNACRAAHSATGADVVLGLGFDNWGCGVTPDDIAQSRALAQDVGAVALIWFAWPDIGFQGLGSTGLLGGEGGF